MKLSPRIGSILHNSLVNGEGIRTVVFFSGCNRGCEDCHNKQLQDFRSGKDMTIDEIVEEILQDKDMIDGVTLSGGDPIFQYFEVLELCKRLKTHGINIWMYTGATLDEICAIYPEVVNCVDVIVDGMYDKSKKIDGLKYRGSYNQNIIYFRDGSIVKMIGGKASDIK